jgi:hypothetical protein
VADRQQRPPRATSKKFKNRAIVLARFTFVFHGAVTTST